jgi:nucleoside-diphosphate-sugar epimerase
MLLGLAEKPVVFANLRGNVPFMHVRDLCAAALFLAQHAGSDGEAYNTTDDGRLDAVATVRIIADELGTKARILPPMPIPLMRKALSVAARLDMARSRKKGKRPLLEYDQVQYFGRDYLYSNDKLKQTGFEMHWPQPEPGLRETLRWYVERGWLELSGGKARRRR